MADDDDLYGDLKVSQETVMFNELEKNLKEEMHKNAQLTKRVVQLEASEQALRQQVEVLERNISCLYNTAKEEIQRKDKTISELQKQAIQAEVDRRGVLPHQYQRR